MGIVKDIDIAESPKFVEAVDIFIVERYMAIYLIRIYRLIWCTILIRRSYCAYLLNSVNYASGHSYLSVLESMRLTVNISDIAISRRARTASYPRARAQIPPCGFPAAALQWPSLLRRSHAPTVLEPQEVVPPGVRPRMAAEL